MLTVLVGMATLVAACQNPAALDVGMPEPAGVQQSALVPAHAPDSVPAAVWARLISPANLMTNAPHIRGTWVRNALYVMFKPGTSQVARQAAIDLVKGEVVGGAPLGGAEKFYVVRIPYSLTKTDGISGPVLSASKTLRALRTVESAAPIGLDKPALHR